MTQLAGARSATRVTAARHAAGPGSSPSGSGGQPLAATHEDLSPWQPGAQDPWDARKARHLMRRAGFSAPGKDIDTLVKIGHKLATDIVLLMPGEEIPTAGVFQLAHGELINLSNTNDSVAAWLYLMANSKWQLQEKLALFWHDHFATGISKVRYPELMTRQINVFRRHALGNFRDLLIEISADPAMLYWLDNRLSRATKPNENYAREIMELFSMGIGGGYTEKDIQEAARCFSGWYCLLDRSYFQPRYHDLAQKTVLGKTIYNPRDGRQDGIDVIDAILAQPATAKYMVKKIWEYFVYLDPSQKLVDELAARWRKDGYDVRALMETIFRSKAFYSSHAYRTLVKSPPEFVVGAMRQLNCRALDYGRLTNRFNQLGLPLYNYSDPDGLEEGTSWINSQTVINRSNFAMELIRQRNSYLRYVTERRAYLPPMATWDEVQAHQLDTPAKIVDFYLELLVDSDVPKKVRDDLVSYMTRTDSGTRSWNAQTQVPEKVSGLCHLILALPEAQMN